MRLGQLHQMADRPTDDVSLAREKSIATVASSEHSGDVASHGGLLGDHGVAHGGGGRRSGNLSVASRAKRRALQVSLMLGYRGRFDSRSCLSLSGGRIRRLVIGLQMLQIMIWETLTDSNRRNTFSVQRHSSRSNATLQTSTVLEVSIYLEITCKPWMNRFIRTNRGLGHVSAGRQVYGMR